MGTCTARRITATSRFPFPFPVGTERATIIFDYTGRDQHTALDPGLLDPTELRCWSGGNKSTFTVGLMDATPSCLLGAMPPGRWNVLIGMPNICANVESHYIIHVYFSRTGAVAQEPDVLRQPLRAGPAWFRGDVHMHTAHSDCQCLSQTGKIVPCPVFFTVEAAERRAPLRPPQIRYLPCPGLAMDSVIGFTPKLQAPMASYVSSATPSTSIGTRRPAATPHFDKSAQVPESIRRTSFGNWQGLARVAAHHSAIGADEMQ